MKEWKSYNKLCQISSFRLSLFFLEKKAFKAFIKESRQDLYSSKVLLDKAFSLNLYIRQRTYLGSVFSNSHLAFCRTGLFKTSKLCPILCVHCGMNVSLLPEVHSKE